MPTYGLLMVVPGQSSTRVDQVFAELRSDILAGRCLPGARLRMAELAARHGASMGVLREALSRLAAQGLVVAEPQHGFQVTPISVTDLGTSRWRAGRQRSLHRYGASFFPQ